MAGLTDPAFPSPADLAVQRQKVKDALVMNDLQRLTDDDFVILYPTVSRFLFPKYDGKALLRQEGRISIVASGYEWRIGIDMPSERMAGAIFIPTLDDIWPVLEDAAVMHKIKWVEQYNSRKDSLRRLDKLLQS